MHSLRVRFLVSISLVAVLALLALLLIARLLIYPNLISQENVYANQELDRVQSTLQGHLDSLGGVTRDWANWDASYDFMLGRRPDYTVENFSQEMFEDTRHLMMVYLDLQGNPVWIAGHNPQTNQYSTCSTPAGDCGWTAATVSVIQAHVRGQHEGLDRWLLSTPSPMMAATSSILPTDPQAGPTVGWLTIVRDMDADWLASVRAQTGIDIAVEPRLHPAPNLQLPALMRVDRDRLMISRQLTAVPDNTLLELRAMLPRRDFAANWQTFHFAMFWTAALLVVVLTVVLLLLERIVLSPTRRLALFTREQCQQTGPVELPVSLIARRDEIGSLARQFQQLLRQQQAQTESLKRLSRHDHLTGPYNRRYLDEQLHHLITRAQRDHVSLGVITLDIDHFKAYNDHYGHPAGDYCLQQVARTMKHCLGNEGIIARSGGEEFTVLLTNCAPKRIRMHAERLRAAIDNLALGHEYSPTADHVTISSGIAVFDPCHPCSAEELVQRADRMLYRAKLAGRNRMGDDEQVRATGPEA
ncbi:diguanylate cyclase (GGDEF)-like protein [Kushneria sinocarnis]|uniref:diguanylate cyclase n=1 Tax=Kushneria sinocarnis TaxID=595502 RepID=A0A420WV22_9GAMM|nr:diguanylate cyclase [Kushneria sinocarnis]RKR02396.1 diguanylate cyclase (GGDEF)-like protein [Kushneria sinocarnis]